MNFSKLLKTVRSNHFFRYGLPFITFVFGGSFVLKEFASVRYEVSRHKKQLGITPELLKESGFESKHKSLEEEYKTLISTTDLDNWKNIRGQRPWEETTQDYKDMIERRIQEQNQKTYKRL